MENTHEYYINKTQNAVIIKVIIDIKTLNAYEN